MPISVDLDVNISKNASAAIRRAQDSRIKDAMGKGFAVSMEHVPEDRSTLRMSMFEPTKDEDGTWRYGARSQHARPMEEGTDPFTPPVRPLLEWADRVFGTQSDPSTSEVMRRIEADEWGPDLFGHAGLAVWSKIRSEGIDAQPYLQPGSEAAKQYLASNSFSSYLEREL